MYGVATYMKVDICVWPEAVAAFRSEGIPFDEGPVHISPDTLVSLADRFDLMVRTIINGDKVLYISPKERGFGQRG